MYVQILTRPWKSAVKNKAKNVAPYLKIKSQYGGPKIMISQGSRYNTYSSEVEAPTIPMHLRWKHLQYRNVTYRTVISALVRFLNKYEVFLIKMFFHQCFGSGSGGPVSFGASWIRILLSSSKIVRKPLISTTVFCKFFMAFYL